MKRFLVVLLFSLIFMGAAKYTPEPGSDPAYRIHERSGTFYAVDNSTGSETSLAAGDLANIVTVSPSGADYTSLKSAVDYITTQSPTSSNRWQISVGPGVYTEAPMTVVAYVDIAPTGEKFTTKIIASNNSTALFTTSGAGPIGIGNLTIDGPDSNSAFLNSTAAVALGVSDCTILDTQYGFRCTAGIITTEDIGTTPASSMTNMFRAEGGVIMVDTCTVLGTAAFTDFIYNDGGTVSAKGIYLSGTNITTGFNTMNGGTSGAWQFKMGAGTTGIKLDNASYFEGGTIVFDSALTTHIEVVDASSEIHISSAEMNSDNFTFPASYSGDIIFFLDHKTGDQGARVFGELGVGRPERGTETVLGEGDSYTRGMKVYTYDAGITTYTDVSTAALSSSGSTFAIPGVDINDAVYIASSLENSDKLQFYGIKIGLVTAPVVGGGGIDTEYYNGSSWVHFDRMLTDSSGSYWPHGESLAQTPGSYQMRFTPAMLDDWGKNDLPGYGTNLYWIRIRNTGGITTAPVFEQLKLHTSRTEINSDGFIEYMGAARPIRELPWNVAQLSDVGATMANDDLWMGQNIGRSFVDAVFNGDGDYAGFVTKLPDDLDTSVPITLQFATMGLTTGDVRWIVHWGYTSDGDTISETNPGAPVSQQDSTTLATVENVTANTQKWWSAELDVSPMIARRSGGFGDTLWVSIERHTDTEQNQVLMVISGQYTTWCLGGHQ